MSHDVPPPTARLRFREYRPDDLDAVVAMFSDAEARQWYPTTAAPEESAAWIQWNLRNYATHGFGLWVVEDRATGAFLGDCGLTLQDVEGQSVLEIGYHLLVEHRGNGYAVEAAQACLDFAFDVLAVESVCSIVDPHNESSQRVASAIHETRRTFTRPDGSERFVYETRATN